MPPESGLSGAGARWMVLQERHARLGRVIRMTPSRAGTRSCISLLVLPVSCRSLPQSRQALWGAAMTVSRRGRWAGSGAR